MCPSYQATRNEKDTTRARANALREFLTQTSDDQAFAQAALKEVMDLCISCKGCTGECPSNVDLASMKAEFLHQYYQHTGVPLRAKAFAHINDIHQQASRVPRLYNFFLRHPATSHLLKKALGVATARQLPLLHQQPLRQWFTRNFRPARTQYHREVYLFCDEFTNYLDTPVGQHAVLLLDHLGYKVHLIDHPESGRAAISKGLLPLAKRLAEEQVQRFSSLINAETPLLGIEPSAILSFRDEYPRLVSPPFVEAARQLAPHCLLIDEFLSREIQAGRITADAFTQAPAQVLLHAHCHQKALGDLQDTVWMLSLPVGYSVEVIPSGCCGMAGSFGYEAEHYEVSIQIGELVLLPAIRKAPTHAIIAANGTSCRHQIADGAGRNAKHPVTILWEAYENKNE
ncbi:MAG: 4Fe-4S dicluster domain-containing protein [Saprospiraceae bacterium]